MADRSHSSDAATGNDLAGDEKVAYENAVVEKARALAAELAQAEGGHVSSATATTNTTGSVNVLA